MATAFHNVVRNYDIIDSSDYIAFNLPTTLTTSDIGKAVALDTGAANKVKLAGAGDVILGRLETVEVRSASQVVGTVALRGIFKLPIKSGESFSVGDTAEGSATAGSVQILKAGSPAASAPNPALNQVIEVVGSTHVIVLKH